MGGWGGWGGMITYLALAHTLAEHIPCVHGWVGWVGWGGMITYLALAHTLAEHITCIHGWVGWVGWDDHVPCATKLLLQHYSGTTPYYKVLLRSSTTPVLQSNTSTTPVPTPYYKVPLQYYSVLQSITPVLLRYYTVILQYHPGTTPYYKVLLRSSTTPVLQSSTSTKQCACREKVTL